MIPWIQVYSNLAGHKKTCKLRDGLGFSANYQAVGVLVCLWSWAAVNAPDGNLKGYSARDIADAVGYRKSPTKLLEELVSAGFIDRDADTFHIHDWEEHAALLMDSEAQQRKNTRERVQRYRERQKQRENADGNADSNVTCNACNAPTLPNLTLPNQNSGGDGGESAGAREVSAEKLASIGLKPGEYLYVTDAIVDQIVELGAKLAGTYTPMKSCSPLDYRKVFEHTARTHFSECETVIDTSAASLLEYAFEAAFFAGKAGNWSYIDGIMARCRARGVMTAQMAREWDEDRPDTEL